MKYKGRGVFIHFDIGSPDGYLLDALNSLQIPVTSEATAVIIRSMKTKMQFFNLPSGTDINFDALDHWVSSYFGDVLSPTRVQVTEE